MISFNKYVGDKLQPEAIVCYSTKMALIVGK